MGLFSRLKDLLEANISELINKAEDPEKMLNLYIERAIEELKNFNVQVNRAVADELQLKQKITASEKEIESWGSQAKAAVIQNRDDLARLALDRKRNAETSLASYQTQLTAQQQAVQDLQTSYRILEEKLNKARSERDELVMRQRRAKAMKEASEAVQNISGNSALSDFDRMRDKVGRMEAEAQSARISATNTVEDQFDQLKKAADKTAVDDELAKLKAELGQGKE